MTPQGKSAYPANSPELSTGQSVCSVAVEDCDAYVGTCDLGCDRPTEALVLTEDGSWLSACRPCAHVETRGLHD